MQHDAVVVGGSYAGLSAALHVARARRSVCIVDAGSPRNRFAASSHGLFGHDGAVPRAVSTDARAQVAAYPNVRSIAGEAVDARAVPGGFEVSVSGGETLAAKKLVLAFGISDVLPDLPGLSERWGTSVLHCPYCHGFEHGGGRLGVLATLPISAHQAALIADWGPTTFYLHGGDMPDDATRAMLSRRDVAIEPTRIRALRGAGRHLSAIVLEDGREVNADAMFLATRSRLNSPIAERLGCTMEDGPFGPVIRTDTTKLTSVPGVYAAGDVARVPHNASWATADGVTAGISLHQSLAFESSAA